MKPLIAFLLIVGSFIPVAARDLSRPPARISGTKVETEAAARLLAFGGYIRKMNGHVSASEAVLDASVVRLALPSVGFAEKNEPIWELRVTERDAVRGVIWINPRTEDMRFLSGAWESGPRGTNAPSNSRTGDSKPQVESEQAAKQALNIYSQRLGKPLDDDFVETTTMLTLGYDIQGFARKGAKVWEARIARAFDDRTTGLIEIAWINTDTGQVLFLTGKESVRGALSGERGTITNRVASPVSPR